MSSTAAYVNHLKQLLLARADGVLLALPTLCRAFYRWYGSLNCVVPPNGDACNFYWFPLDYIVSNAAFHVWPIAIVLLLGMRTDTTLRLWRPGMRFSITIMGVLFVLAVVFNVFIFGLTPISLWAPTLRLNVFFNIAGWFLAGVVFCQVYTRHGATVTPDVQGTEEISKVDLTKEAADPAKTAPTRSNGHRLFLLLLWTFSGTFVAVGILWYFSYIAPIFTSIASLPVPTNAEVAQLVFIPTIMHPLITGLSIALARFIIRLLLHQGYGNPGALHLLMVFPYSWSLLAGRFLLSTSSDISFLALLLTGMVVADVGLELVVILVEKRCSEGVIAFLVSKGLLREGQLTMADAATNNVINEVEHTRVMLETQHLIVSTIGGLVLKSNWSATKIGPGRLFVNLLFLLVGQAVFSWVSDLILSLRTFLFPSYVPKQPAPAVVTSEQGKRGVAQPYVRWMAVHAVLQVAFMNWFASTFFRYFRAYIAARPLLDITNLV